MSEDAATTFDPRHVAMFVDGREKYGIGTIVRLYTLVWPDATYVAFGTGPLLDYLKDGGFPVIERPVTGFTAVGASSKTLATLPGGMLRSRREALTLEPMLKERGVRFVQTQRLTHQLVAGFLRKRGFRVGWQINNNTTASRLFGLGIKMNHALARWGADLLLPASDFIAANWLASGVPSQTVRNAAEPMHENPPEPASLPPLRCLTAGRLTPSKGHHIAIKAIRRLLDEGVQITLDCYGSEVSDEDHAYADELRQLAGPHLDKSITLRGFVDDLRQRHREYDVGLQCRLDPEPCSLWVCESLVDGLPLLATATGGTPELVADGSTGLLYASGDADDLAAKLRTIAADQAKLRQWQQAAYDRGQADFTVQAFDRRTRQAWGTLDGVDA
ncbi:MAG: glycosyltransferase family 4 protein [Planctomycetota bacterium]